MKTLEELLTEAFNKGFKTAQTGRRNVFVLLTLRDWNVRHIRERVVRLIASRWSRHAEANRAVGKRPRQ